MTINLKRIKTDTAEYNFNELLKEKKTLFLNGTWGSGKTEFLERVNDKSDKTFKFLDLWITSDNRSVIEQGFKLLHPFIYWLWRLVLVIGAFIFVLISYIFKMESFAFHGINILIIITFAIVMVYQTFGVKSDAIYVWLFDYLKFGLRNNVLIIDDFDRIEPEKQNESYKLFNKIKGKLPVVFVGDIQQIYNTNTPKYLQKIIDLQVELPIALDTSMIWEDFATAFKEATNYDFNTEILYFIKNEKRNLRDRFQYTELLNRELFQYKKLEHVQLDQLVVINYIYLFYPFIYSSLKTVNSADNQIFKSEKLKNIKVLIDFLKLDKGFPKPFIQLKNSYFVYESINNMTAQDVHHVLNSRKLIDKYLMIDTFDSDISLFLNYQWEDINHSEKNLIYTASIELARNEVYTSLIDFVIHKNDEEKLPHKKILSTQSHYAGILYSIPPEWNDMTEEEIYIKRLDLWIIDLTERKFDKSEIILFLIHFRITNFYTIGQYMNELNLDSLQEVKHPDQIMLAYLSKNSIFYTPLDWSTNIWNKLNEFSEKSFVSFWMFLGYVRELENYEEYEILKTIPDYVNNEFNNISVDKNIADFIRKYFLKNNIKFVD